jgi:type I restriction enzyme S subunit
MSTVTTHINNKPSLKAGHCEDEGRSKLKQSHPLVPALRFKEFEGEWQILKLKEVAKIARGKFTPRPRNNPIYYNGVIPFVQTSDVVNANGKIEVYTQTLNAKGLAVSKLFPAGTILITIAANIGHVGVLQIDMACPDSLIGITPNDETHNYFLNYYLATHQKKMDYLAPEGAQKNINIDFLNPYKVPSTSLPEQQKIASFLSAVDEKIQQLTKKKALLEDYKKGVMQQLFSGHLRFKDENGKPYPDWEEKRLGEIGKTFNGLTGKTKVDFGEGKPYIQYMQIFRGSKIKPDEFGFVKLNENEKQSRAQFGDAFFTTSSETPKEIGTASVLLDEIEELYLNSFCFGYRPDNLELIVPQFLQFLLRSEIFRRKIIPLAQGSTRYNMSKVQLMKLIVAIPCSEEQQKIATYLSSIDTKLEAVNTQITQTQTFKKGLLQQLFV